LHRKFIQRQDYLFTKAKRNLFWRKINSERQQCELRRPKINTAVLILGTGNINWSKIRQEAYSIIVQPPQKSVEQNPPKKTWNKPESVCGYCSWLRYDSLRWYETRATSGIIRDFCRIQNLSPGHWDWVGFSSHLFEVRVELFEVRVEKYIGTLKVTDRAKQESICSISLYGTPPLEEWGSALIYYRDTKDSIRDMQAQVGWKIRPSVIHWGPGNDEPTGQQSGRVSCTNPLRYELTISLRIIIGSNYNHPAW